MKEKSVESRYEELDSIRGLAALTVFFSHAILMSCMSPIIRSKITYNPLHIFWDGYAAVILFFVLSGFVLSLPYIGPKNKDLDIIPFIIRRIFRIYPAYIVIILLALVVRHTIFDWNNIQPLSLFARDFWDYTTATIDYHNLLQHIIMIGPKFNGGTIDPVIWSLIVEMKISLIFPIIILLFKKYNKLWQNILVFAGSILIYILTKNFTLSYLPIFIIGAIIAKYHVKLVSYVKAMPKIFVGFLMIISLLLYTFTYSFYDLMLSDIKLNYIISVGVSIILILALSIEWIKKILLFPPIKLLGKVSYSFYLIHFPVLMTIGSLTIPYFHSTLVWWAVSLATSVIASYIVYKLIEQPFQNLGRKAAAYCKFDFVKKQEIKTSI